MKKVLSDGTIARKGMLAYNPGIGVIKIIVLNGENFKGTKTDDNDCYCDFKDGWWINLDQLRKVTKEEIKQYKSKKK
jgi:hypothetical protein